MWRPRLRRRFAAQVCPVGLGGTKSVAKIGLLVAGAAVTGCEAGVSAQSGVSTHAEKNHRATLAGDASGNGDLDRDGLPDAIELRSENERAAFTGWFTAIAEAQFHRLDDDWAKVHHDCAGLVRFAFREALKPHDADWWARRGWPPSGARADVARLRYPNLPIVTDRPFRRRSGPYDANDPVEAQFTAAPSARTLWMHNSDLIARDVSQARAGDLLFFRLARGAGSRMHTMIALGRRPGADHRAPAERLVYHTGPSGSGPGEVRLVTVGALVAHPEPGWRPVPHNARFLGVHRLRHLTAPAAWAGATRSL